MVDLMGLLSDALIGSFQMLMLNDLGKNMFPYRIIVAFGGRQDNEAEEEAIKQWSHYTDNTFQYEIFEGDHFYLKEHEDMVIEQLKKHLKRIEHESKNLP